MTILFLLFQKDLNSNIKENVKKERVKNHQLSVLKMQSSPEKDHPKTV